MLTIVRRNVDERIEASIELEAVQLDKLQRMKGKLALKTEGLTASGKKMIWAKYDADVTAIAHEGAQNRGGHHKRLYGDEENDHGSKGH